MSSAGLDPLGASAADPAAYTARTVDKWAKAIRATGLKLE